MFKETLDSLDRFSAGRPGSSSVALQVKLPPESCFWGVNLYSDRTELDPGSPEMMFRTASPLSQVRVRYSVGYRSYTWQVRVDSAPNLRRS